jgi:hypothetical protein
VLTKLDMDRSGSISRRRRTSGRRRRSAQLGSATEHRKRKGDRDSTGTVKRKGNDETNAMVCSPSAKDERWRRKSSPELERSSLELGKMTEATSDSRV